MPSLTLIADLWLLLSFALFALELSLLPSEFERRSVRFGGGGGSSTVIGGSTSGSGTGMSPSFFSPPWKCPLHTRSCYGNKKTNNYQLEYIKVMIFILRQPRKIATLYMDCQLQQRRKITLNLCSLINPLQFNTIFKSSSINWIFFSKIIK